MSILQTIKEEIVPLSSRQGLVLYITIACVFQFVLFYAPALAEDAIKQASTNEIVTAEIKIHQTNAQTEPWEMPLAHEDINIEDNNANEEELRIKEIIEKVETEEEIVLAENTTNVENPIINEEETNLVAQKSNPMANKVIANKTNANKTLAKEATPLDNEITETATTSAEVGPKVIRTSTHVMTAYNSDPRQTDDTPCITANGFNVCEHGVEDTIAANFLKFGTKVMIPELFGDRVFIVRDRMNKRYPDRVDIWMINYDDAKKFGVKVAEIKVIE
ncbi:MAG: hypothetical protein ACOX0H_03800 [Patescibacteria group bacterium]|jgi:3D (Asp-Asp-Asp) domain-containing protein|nr:hypothetical protein [bacterium]HQC49924.1 hypothetical protein [bacterium]